MASVSRNLVELVRRHHEQGAPTALDVLKEAMDQRGEITDHDRRVAAVVLGPARSRRPRRVDVRPTTCRSHAARASRARVHRDGLLRRHRRYARRPRSREAFGLSLGERAGDRSVSLAETVCLGYCHAGPAVRDGDVIDAGPGAIERLDRQRLAARARAPSSKACSPYRC